MEHLPLLPGHCFSDVTRTNFLVPRTLSFKNGHRIIRRPRFGIGQTYKQDIQLTEDEHQLLANFHPELIYGKVRVQEARKFVPINVFYDKKILRFYGYFKQTVHENPLESYRIRSVIIYYYLEDDTIAIYETPSKNSALVQGLRVRRHRISKNNQNEPYNWRDFNLGENLFIYSIVYRICDCDRFTREWLESEGIEVQPSEPIPSDPYTQKLIEKNEIEKQRIDQNSSKEQIINNHKFKNMDGKVLRFYAIFENQSSQYEILRKFIIHLYLVDNTIEIRELHRSNTGYDPIAIYLHRQIVPKDSTYNIKSFVNLFINQYEQNKINYFKPDDFILGHCVTIFNRIFFLYDCDTFTRNFYHQYFCHLDFTPIDIDAQRYKKPMTQLPHLLPKKPIKNHRSEDENRMLRYEAKMESANEDDRCRRFLIVYRLADGLISVYEKPLDGFGCLTTKFLERIRVPKPDSHSDEPTYYGPNDFYIGAHVEFFKHRFLITDADHSVSKFIEENQQQFSAHVIDSFRKNGCSYKEKDEQVVSDCSDDTSSSSFTGKTEALMNMMKNVVFIVLLSIVLCLMVNAGPTRRENEADETSCENKQCVEQEIYCICGVTVTPNDRCGCPFTCNTCPDNWWKPPVYWNLDLSGLVLPPLDFSGMFNGWGKKK